MAKGGGAHAGGPKRRKQKPDLDEEEPWRLTRLVRTDARVRELLRILTPEEPEGDASVGERIWTQPDFQQP